MSASLFAIPAGAQRVEVAHGNVRYVPASGPARVLTTGGRDSVAVLSPDGRTVVVVRYTGRTVQTALDESPATDLVRVDVRTGVARGLVRARGSATPERTLASFSDVAFSPDSRTVYFVSGAWVVSGAVHAVDVATGRERYLMPGNSVAVVPRGKYRGHLMVGQHRYFLGQGSYDWVWLMTPAGRQVGPIGETDEQVAEFLETYASPPSSGPVSHPQR